MESPTPEPDATITVLCVECGELIEVRDPASLIRALHLVNSCTLRVLLGKEEG